MKWLILIGLLVLAGVFIFSGDSVNSGLLQSLRADAGKCDRMMKNYQLMGLVRSVRPGSTTWIEVEDARWAQVSHDMKVSVGLVAYCLYSPSDGRHHVMIRGFRDGAVKGSVINGHFSS